jgi:hypothetical protein
MLPGVERPQPVYDGKLSARRVSMSSEQTEPVTEVTIETTVVTTETTVVRRYFEGECTCDHFKEEHGMGLCGVGDCTCEAGWCE